MRLVVCSHKPCWPSPSSPTGYATDGGFSFQMQALSQLFESTSLLVPCAPTSNAAGEIPLQGHNLSVRPLPMPGGSGLRRKLRMIVWALCQGPRLFREIVRADAVHTPIPGDIGTIGMLLAYVLRKPLFVRYCGNWLTQQTAAEHFWRWFMERLAGGRNVMLATGGSDAPPSARTKEVRWIFSTSLTERELKLCGKVRRRPPPGSVRLVIACRQEREKGTGLVLEGLAQLVQDFPAATLDVLGDGGALRSFQNMAEKLGLARRVTFHGKVDHEAVLRQFQCSDIFCFPTLSSEGFPKVVLEALACGLPVLTTKVSVLPQLIGRGGGMLLEEAQPAALAEAVRAMLSSEEQYQAMSANAIATAAEYSLERWRDTIGDLLRAAWRCTLG
jgi:glycosyltransferase involved in cell wall biosynthesis